MTIFDKSVSFLFSVFGKIAFFVIENFEYFMVELVQILVSFNDLYLHSTIHSTKGYTNARELYFCLFMYVQLRLEMQDYPKTEMFIYQK